jgi:hypothetical protein
MEMKSPTAIARKADVRIFVAQYLANGCRPVDAYRAACHLAPDAPVTTSFPGKACRFLKSTAVQQELARVVSKRAEAGEEIPQRSICFKALDYSSEAVLREIARIAMIDIGQLYDADGNLKPLADMPASTRRAITEIEHGVDKLGVPYIKKVKLASKTAALEQLAKIHKLYSDAPQLNIQTLTKVEILAEIKKILAGADKSMLPEYNEETASTEQGEDNG